MSEEKNESLSITSGYRSIPKIRFQLEWMVQAAAPLVGFGAYAAFLFGGAPFERVVPLLLVAILLALVTR